MRLHHKDKIALLLLLDVSVMTAAFIFALLFGHKAPMTMLFFSIYGWGLVTLIASVVTVFFILDLYSLHKIPERFITQVLQMTLGLSLSAIIVTFVFFFFRNTVPRAVFILFYIFSVMLIATSRYYFSKFTGSLIYWRALVVGERIPCEKIVQITQQRGYLHSQIIGHISTTGDKAFMASVPHLGSVDRLLPIVAQGVVDHVIVATTKLDDNLTKVLLDCMKAKIKVTDFRKYIETVVGKVPIEYLNDTWFLDELSTTDKRYYWYVKRSLDVILSLIGIGLSILFLPIIALLIKIDSRGPVFYSHLRIGRGNQPFRVWKLRTMVQDADKTNVHWTTDNDVRVTRTGKYLRKIRIDEVPQLFNILKGDMTLIGPRPEAESLVEMYQNKIPYYNKRHMVTPGITGWAQINYRYGNSIEDTREKLKYDFYYIKNRSIVLDSIIFLRTIRIVLTGKGAL